MKITCPACGSAFEADALPARSSAPCPSCGAQCTVPVAVDAGPKTWTLRRTDGTLTKFEGAATLQKWIAEGLALPDDEMSRDGTQWQKLAANEKLARVFSRRQEILAAAAANRAAAPAPATAALPVPGTVANVIVANPVMSPVKTTAKFVLPMPGPSHAAPIEDAIKPETAAGPSSQMEPQSRPAVATTDARKPVEAVPPVKMAPPIKTAAVAKTEPVKTEPVKTLPVKTQPVKTEPVKTEPVKTEPVKTEPAKTQPVKTPSPVKTQSPLKSPNADAPTPPPVEVAKAATTSSHDGIPENLVFTVDDPPQARSDESSTGEGHAGADRSDKSRARDSLELNMRVLGKYTLAGSVRETAIGRVYRAWSDDPAQIKFHVHVVRRASMSRRQLVEAFVRQIRLLESLQHRCIVRVLDSGVEYGVPVVVTADDLTVTLRERLEDAGAGGVSWKQTARIIADVASALDYLHTRTPPITHRMLDPRSIFMVGEPGVARLHEVGLLHALDNAPHDPHSGPGPAWMPRSQPPFRAPEEDDAPASIGPATDQYALASIAFECLFGMPAPLNSRGRADVRAAADALPPRLAEVLARGWSESMADRFPSAGAFSEALAEVFASVSVRVATVSADAAESPPAAVDPAFFPAETPEVARASVAAAVDGPYHSVLRGHTLQGVPGLGLPVPGAHPVAVDPVAPVAPTARAAEPLPASVPETLPVSAAEPQSARAPDPQPASTADVDFEIEIETALPAPVIAAPEKPSVQCAPARTAPASTPEPESRDAFAAGPVTVPVVDNQIPFTAPRRRAFLDPIDEFEPEPASPAPRSFPLAKVFGAVVLVGALGSAGYYFGVVRPAGVTAATPVQVRPMVTGAGMSPVVAPNIPTAPEQTPPSADMVAADRAILAGNGRVPDAGPSTDPRNADEGSDHHHHHHRHHGEGDSTEPSSGDGSSARSHARRGGSDPFDSLFNAGRVRRRHRH